MPWLRRSSSREAGGTGPARAVAAKALLGSSFKVTQHRGELLDSDLAPIVSDIHPSAILRQRDDGVTRARGVCSAGVARR